MFVLCVVLFRVYFLVLFEVLGPFESLAANLDKIGEKQELKVHNDPVPRRYEVSKGCVLGNDEHRAVEASQMRTPKMTSDMVSLCTGCSAILPITSQT